MITNPTDWTLLGLGAVPHPARSLAQLRNEMDRLWSGSPMIKQEAVKPLPRVTLHDSGESLTLSAELPGCNLDDIDITVTGETLTLRARREVATPEGYAVRLRERRPVTLDRQLTLPYRVAADEVVASYSRGVLSVVLPKAPEARPKRIAIKSDKEEV